ncbi:hypothetical protein B0J17DRAFT_702663 [Rhizoctonia solani]|nr:hypothetical protein B0J17DRAFT_702663 [Rhizoctonia solani]
MDPTLLPSPSSIKRDTVPEKNSELTDTAILLRHYKFNEIQPNFYEIGQGTPQGDAFSMRPRLVPVPRWLGPKPMSSFNILQRQPCFYPRDPRKEKNFRSVCWMHADSSLLPNSPLNNTAHRAFMPARPKIPLKGSMFRAPRPRQQPSNSLRAFGTILPGSTLQTYKLSIPLARDANGHIIDAPKPLKPGPIPIPIPLPGVAKKNLLLPCSDGARVMVHRMNLARRKWNTVDIRTRRLSRYVQLASGIASPTTSEVAGPILGNLTYRIDGLYAYTKRMETIESSESRHEEATTLAKLRHSFHKLLRSEQTSNAELGGLSSQGFDSSHKDPVEAKMQGQADSQQPSLTELAPIIRTTRSIEGQQPPISLRPKPHQSRSRAPAPYSVPSTRVLRSMSKAKPDNVPAPAISADTHIPCVVTSSSVHRRPRKELKPKQVPPANANGVLPIPANTTLSTSRYNLRPRKRKLGKDETSERGDKQASRPVKRRRV